MKSVLREKITALVALALIALTLSTTSCRHKVDTTNPVVVKAVTLSNAEKTVNTIAHGILAADQTIDQIKLQEPDYYAAVSPKLKIVAQLNETANQCIVTSVNGGICDWQTEVATIAKFIGDPNSLTTFGFKNPDTQKKVQLGLAILISGIQMAAQFQKGVQ